MSETDKKSKDTIVISKRHLYLIIFLVIIAIAVAIAVPTTIHLKQKRNNAGKEEPDKPVVINEQIGKDGVFFAVLEEEEYYDVDEEEGEDEEDEDDDNNLNARTDCATPIYGIDIDESTDTSDVKSISDCAQAVPILYGEESDYQGQIISNVSEFVDLFGFESNKYDDQFFYNHTLVSIVTHMDYCGGVINRVYLSRTNKNTGVVTIDYESSCGPCPDEMNVYLIELNTDKDEKISKVEPITNANYNDTAVKHCNPGVEKKPVVYLYPTSTIDVNVELGAPEKLTVSYPKYTDAWRVTANPDGSLIDRTTGRNLYSLYYEADYTTAQGVRDEGFVIKGADSASFLEEKLAQLGLNEREAEEFIIYWLPQLEKNAYNYVYFAPSSEIAENMPLKVSPAPETVIRINMEFKALDAPIQVKEQKLPATPIRKGFTLVEWGGTSL